MRTLSQDIGIRFGGTEGEHRAARWLRDQFARQGVPARLQQYRFIGWEPDGTPEIEAIAPSRRAFSAAPIIYSAATPAGGVTGRVAWHGKKHLITGLYEMDAYAVLDDDGNQLAQLIVEPGGSAIPLLNPHPIYRIPLIVIGAEDHRWLQERLGRGDTVTVRAQIGARLIPDATSYNVIAEYRGNPRTSRRVVVDAHYDTQLNTPGCYDNASGVAGLFELLRRTQAGRLPINLDIVAVASEEIGMHGSSYLVLDLKERDELRHVSACICLDQISAGETLWIWATPGAFRERVMRSVQVSGLDRLGPVKVDDPMPGCDMWPFHREGIPGCLYMWWRLPDYHRPTDTIDKVEPAKVEGCVQAAFLLLQELALESGGERA
jgi:hypothetical protein